MGTLPESPGRLGVFLGPTRLSADELAALVLSIERWGYTTLWLPEAIGADPFVLIGYLAARSERLIFGTGIANIYARDAMAMKAACKTLAVVASGRCIIGLGVSSPKLVSDVRGHSYLKPVPAMRDYLDAMEGALYRGPEPENDAAVVLAALGPLMLRLASQRARGALTYLVTPEHTAAARETLGSERWLCVEQMVLAEQEPARARELGRRAIAGYLTAPGYIANLERLGFSRREIEDKSEPLVDAMVAWGDVESIRERIEAHFRAGADHVCVQALRSDGEPGADVDLLGRLAPPASST